MRLPLMKDLTQYLLLHIFHKLPYKSLALCMCINKHWRAIIKNNASFLSSAQNNGKKGRYLIFWKSDNEFQLYVDNDELESYKLPIIPFKPDTSSHPRPLCNGVLCLATGDESDSDIILWNPNIQKMLTLSKPPIFRYLPKCDWLDNKHVVLGRVLGDGLLVVKKIENVSVGANNRPKLPIIIAECGEM